MKILIVRDGGATKVPREVKSLEEAQAVSAINGEVLVENDDGTTVPLSAYEAPDGPAAAPVEPAPAKKAAKTKKR